MRDEVHNWFEQSKEDLRGAHVALDGDVYHNAVFQAHQATEKALKENRELEKGHSLVKLAEKAGYDELGGIRDLNPEYLTTRHPDMAVGTPADSYDETLAERHIETAEDVIQWVTNKLSE
jgi:HEPN domain-containing protein